MTLSPVVEWQPQPHAHAAAEQCAEILETMPSWTDQRCVVAILASALGLAANWQAFQDLAENMRHKVALTTKPEE